MPERASRLARYPKDGAPETEEATKFGMDCAVMAAVDTPEGILTLFGSPIQRFPASIESVGQEFSLTVHQPVEVSSDGRRGKVVA
jgi:hypothetical protein